MTALPARIIQRWHTWLTTAYDDGRLRYRAALYPLLLAYAIYLAIFDRTDPEPDDEDGDGGPWCLWNPDLWHQHASADELNTMTTVILQGSSYL